MIVGFIFASYSIVANDAIQTLGTLISSNSKRPWWSLWIFTATILVATIIYSWAVNGGDVAYGRLEKYPLPEPFTWIYVVAPITLLILTKFGIPVSTTFLILTVFAPKNLEAMLTKSLMGYVVAILVAFVVVYFVSRSLEKKFAATRKQAPPLHWVILQLCSTGFLWSQWLIQDLANIFVYLPRQISVNYLIFSLILMVTLHGLLFYFRGGEIQKVVLSKTNVSDIRSATIIDFMFAIILFVFKNLSNLPMSTTWVFLGVLAGRELALTLILKEKTMRETRAGISKDMAKAAFGLFISILIATILPKLT